jgi:predicted small lipoprotein YifL
MRFIPMIVPAAALLLASCGQTGPLYLPPGSEPAPPAVATPANLPPGAQTPTSENPDAVPGARVR